MNILFIHRSFPGQFKYLAAALTLDPNNKVVFITEDEQNHIQGVNKILYKSEVNNKQNKYLKVYDFAVSQALSVAKKAQELKDQGFIPDIIYGFLGWGCSMFIKEVFPDVPLLCYCEWYLNPEGAKLGFGGEALGLEDRMKLRCDNSHPLMTLSLCDGAIAPTQWQKNQFPKEFQDKIKVVHDGFDTGIFVPNEEAKFIVKDKNLELTTKDEIITYGTRGFEPCRGFPQFMEAVEVLLKKRPKAHFLIAGDDNVYYSERKEKTYKTLMLEKLNLDMSRVHFVGTLPLKEYIKFLQVSSVHIYLTYPFVLSWSVFEAMSSGCCLVASNTAPVLDVVKDNYNGLLTDFFDVNQLAEKIEYALDNKEKMAAIRENARKTVVNEYDLTMSLYQHIQMIQNLVKK